MAKHPYIKLSGHEAIYRPYVKISLINPHNYKQTPQIRGLIDSGADVCLASKDIALWLGIQFKENDEKISIGTANRSQSYAVKKSVILATEEGRYECPFFFIDDVPPDEPPLLGQLGFFDHFHTCFDWRSKTFEIL